MAPRGHLCTHSAELESITKPCSMKYETLSSVDPFSQSFGRLKRPEGLIKLVCITLRGVLYRATCRAPRAMVNHSNAVANSGLLPDKDTHRDGHYLQ